MTPANARVTRTRTERRPSREAASRATASRLGAVVGRLGVGVDRDALVARAEAHVDGRAVGPAHLDLPRRALLGVALDGVDVPARDELERRGLRAIGAGAAGPTLAIVPAHCLGDPHPAEAEREDGGGGEDRFACVGHGSGLARANETRMSVDSIGLAARRYGRPVSRRVLVLGAGFGGLELSTMLSESGGDFDVTLIDKGDAFVVGYA